MLIVASGFNPTRGRGIDGHAGLKSRATDGKQAEAGSESLRHRLGMYVDLDVVRLKTGQMNVLKHV